MNEGSDTVVGRWITDPEDVESVKLYGRVTLVFSDGGNLRYIIHSKDKDEIINLTYRIVGDTLITQQPSSPRQEESRFTVMMDGRLVLEHSGVRSRYIRSD